MQQVADAICQWFTGICGGGMFR